MARKKKVVAAEGKDYGLPKEITGLLRKQADRFDRRGGYRAVTSRPGRFIRSGR